MAASRPTTSRGAWHVTHELGQHLACCVGSGGVAIPHLATRERGTCGAALQPERSEVIDETHGGAGVARLGVRSEISKTAPFSPLSSSREAPEPLCLPAYRCP